MLRLLVLAGLAAAAFADWPRYRGPNGGGVALDKGLPAELGPNKNVAWKVKTLKGNSSPIVVANKVFLTGHEGEERSLLCFDASTGALLWKRNIEKSRREHHHPLNGPTTPTPATDGRSVFAFFPDFGMAAFDLEGNEKWKAAMGPFGAIQGIAASPVVAEGNVVVLVDTPEEAYLVAFDTKTGKQAWKVERPIGFLGSYATPSLYKPARGPLQLVVSGAVELTGYQAKTGERLWWARGITNGPAALPLVAGDSVYTVEPVGDAAPPFSSMQSQYDKNKDGKIELSEVSGDKTDEKIMYRLFKSIDRHVGNGDGTLVEPEFNASFSPDRAEAGLVRTKLGGKGDVSKTHVAWREKKGMPYVTAPLLHEGVLYVVRDGGILATYRPETGEKLHEERLKDALGAYYASPVAGDGKIYFVSKEGKTTVIRAGEKWEVLSSGDLDEQVIATPAISGNRIYVRTDRTLYCFGTVPSREP